MSEQPGAQPIDTRLFAGIKTGGIWNVGVITIMAAHVVLGFVMIHNRDWSTLHALITLSLGLWCAINGKLKHVAFVGCYIVGAEVFWRMNKAVVPWEFGKYALSFVFLTALVSTRRIRGPYLPLLYFLLLIPSIWLTGWAVGPSETKDFVSFNLSGPFALFVSAWFFSHLRLTAKEIQQLLLAVVGPVVSIVTIAAFRTVTAEEIMFGGESNAVTSGGFGPNQVSSVLGLGALLLFLFIAVGQTRKLNRIGALMGMLVLALQSVLTFSRSGPAMAVGAGTIALLFLVKDRRTRVAVIAVSGLLAALTVFVVLPELHEFTEGAMTNRLTSSTATGRDDIARIDFKIWQENPLLGVGPGRATEYRWQILGEAVAAHTEFTRMVAEHGMLGFLSLVVLFVLCARNLFYTSDPKGRAIIAAFVTWSILFFLVNGFRLVAPALLLGFTCAAVGWSTPWSMRTENRHGAPYTK